MQRFCRRAMCMLCWEAKEKMDLDDTGTTKHDNCRLSMFGAELPLADGLHQEGIYIRHLHN